MKRIYGPVGVPLINIPTGTFPTSTQAEPLVIWRTMCSDTVQVLCDNNKLYEVSIGDLFSSRAKYGEKYEGKIIISDDICWTNVWRPRVYLGQQMLFANVYVHAHSFIKHIWDYTEFWLMETVKRVILQQFKDSAGSWNAVSPDYGYKYTTEKQPCWTRNLHSVIRGTPPLENQAIPNILSKFTHVLNRE